jgi:hypothetical protein
VNSRQFTNASKKSPVLVLILHHETFPAPRGQYIRDPNVACMIFSKYGIDSDNPNHPRVERPMAIPFLVQLKQESHHPDTSPEAAIRAENSNCLIRSSSKSGSIGDKPLLVRLKEEIWHPGCCSKGGNSHLK